MNLLLLASEVVDVNIESITLPINWSEIIISSVLTGVVTLLGAYIGFRFSERSQYKQNKIDFYKTVSVGLKNNVYNFKEKCADSIYLSNELLWFYSREHKNYDEKIKREKDFSSIMLMLLTCKGEIEVYAIQFIKDEELSKTFENLIIIMDEMITEVETLMDYTNEFISNQVEVHQDIGISDTSEAIRLKIAECSKNIFALSTKLDNKLLEKIYKPLIKKIGKF